MKKNLYIIGGCNGAGKTTASFTLMPFILECNEFVNADEIARGISPFQPEKVAFEAGRIMLHRIKELLAKDQTFAFETTLATKSYKNLILEAKSKNYQISLVFFWLEKVQIAIERVATRVREGGHDIPTDVIKRRYIYGLKNLFDIYIPLADNILLFDNSFGQPKLIGKKTMENEFQILDDKIFYKLKSQYNG
ncbi:MAG: zeta toxin [Saprospiraceae bacterium]|nr:zeta toxin [Saprospiraceae bacterium]MBL0112984.1 zeta toxin [Saprospiraceae bacterium]